MTGRILSVDKEEKKLYKRIPGETRNLEDWNDPMNHAIRGIKDFQDKKYRESKKIV